MEITRTGSVAPTWSALVFRGIAGIFFGVASLVWPGVTLAVLTLLFGAYAFADGITALVVAIQHRPHTNRWLLVLDGLVGIAAGIITLFWPGITLLAVIVVLGVRFIVSGVLEIATAIKFRHELRNPFLYGIAGVASIALGILAFATPGVTALVLVTMMGAFALFFGVMMIAVAFFVRRWSRRTTPAPLELAHG